MTVELMPHLPHNTHNNLILTTSTHTYIHPQHPYQNNTINRHIIITNS